MAGPKKIKAGKKILVMYNQHPHEPSKLVVKETLKRLRPEIRDKVFFLNLDMYKDLREARIPKIVDKKVKEIMKNVDDKPYPQNIEALQEKRIALLNDLMKDMFPEFQREFATIFNLIVNKRFEALNRSQKGERLNLLKEHLREDLEFAHAFVGYYKLMQFIEKIQAEQSTTFDHIFNLHGHGIVFNPDEDLPYRQDYIMVHEDHPHRKLYDSIAKETGFDIDDTHAPKMPFSKMAVFEFMYPQTLRSPELNKSSKGWFKKRTDKFAKFLEELDKSYSKS